MFVTQRRPAPGRPRSTHHSESPDTRHAWHSGWSSFALHNAVSLSCSKCHPTIKVINLRIYRWRWRHWQPCTHTASQIKHANTRQTAAPARCIDAPLTPATTSDDLTVLWSSVTLNLRIRALHACIADSNWDWLQDGACILGDSPVIQVPRPLRRACGGARGPRNTTYIWCYESRPSPSTT